jgi:hypothetical protein
MTHQTPHYQAHLTYRLTDDGWRVTLYRHAIAGGIVRPATQRTATGATWRDAVRALAREVKHPRLAAWIRTRREP